MSTVIETRKCEFCNAVAPDDIPTEEMRLPLHRGKGQQTWYSNGLEDPKTGRLVRFYLCPQHNHLAKEAFSRARAKLTHGTTIP